MQQGASSVNWAIFLWHFTVSWHRLGITVLVFAVLVHSFCLPPAHHQLLPTISGCTYGHTGDNQEYACNHWESIKHCNINGLSIARETMVLSGFRSNKHISGQTKRLLLVTHKQH